MSAVIIKNPINVMDIVNDGNNKDADVCNKNAGVCNKNAAWIIVITVILSTIITLVLVFAVTWPYFQASLNRLEQKVEQAIAIRICLACT